MSDLEYVNFFEANQLNQILDKYGKDPTAMNRTLLWKYGQDCKSQLQLENVTLGEFCRYLETLKCMDHLL